MQDALLIKLLQYIEAGQRLSLVTVVKAQGSTPRGAGAKMLVDKSGKTVGTIGGGCPEAEAWQEAKSAARSGQSRLLTVNLAHKGDDKDDGEESMICGGRLHVLVESVLPDAANTAVLAETVKSLRCHGGVSVLYSFLGTNRALKQSSQQITTLDCTCAAPQTEGAKSSESADNSAEQLPYALGQRWAILPDGSFIGPDNCPEITQQLQSWKKEILIADGGLILPLQYQGQDYLVYAEALKPAPRLVIAGAGHVSRPLSRMALLCGWQVTVIDDRADYASYDFFPSDCQLLSEPLGPWFAKLSDNEDVAVVLVTRGHRYDEECLRAIFAKKFAYIGMIGSRRRTAIIKKRLLEENPQCQSWLEQVHAPIGLDLGGETPEEIAVAIMGEIIACRHNASALSVSLSKLRH